SPVGSQLVRRCSNRARPGSCSAVRSESPIHAHSARARGVMKLSLVALIIASYFVWSAPAGAQSAAPGELGTVNFATSAKGPAQAGRAAKAPAGRERGLVEAVDVLFGAGDKYARDVAYSAAMKRLHEQYAGDDEISTLYALSLLGTARPGEKSVRTAMQAAAIAEDIFQRNPKHPGAAHFVIHAFDDPDHAILALPAARAYSKIAPAAAPALHMPSHIFVQLGMWDDVIASTIVAYKAAVDLAEKSSYPRGREDFHTLSWLQYAYLQQGHVADAEKALATAKVVADKDASPRVRDGYAAMKARQIVETAKW